MTAPEDEFWNGIWWVPDGNGRIRNASSAECAREIQRLRAQVERFKRRLQAAGLSHEFEALSGDEQKIPMLDAEEV